MPGGMFGGIIAGLGCCICGGALWPPLGIDFECDECELDWQQLPFFGSGAATPESEPEQHPPEVLFGRLGAICGLCPELGV